MLHLHAENHISEHRQSSGTRALPAGASGKAKKTPPCAPPGPPRAGQGTVGANTWWVTASQLLPVLLPHPPSRHTSPCSFPAAPLGCSRHGAAPPASAPNLPRGKRLVAGVRCACHPDTALHGIYIQPRKAAGLRRAVWQRDRLAACLLERLLAAPPD